MAIGGRRIWWGVLADQHTVDLPHNITPCHYTQYDSRNEDELTKLCERIMGDGQGCAVCRCRRMRTHKRLRTRQFHVHGVTVPYTNNIDTNGQPNNHCHQ